MTCINLMRTTSKQSYIGKQPGDEKSGRTVFRCENGGITPVDHGSPEDGEVTNLR